jgi:hypothetical protein
MPSFQFRESQGGSVETWPDAGRQIWSELDRFPGRVALLVGDADSAVACAFAGLRQATPLHVGRALAVFPQPPSELQIRSTLSGSPVLVGTSILFDPVLRVDAARLICELARREPGRVVEWPVPTTRSPFRWPGEDGPRPVSPALDGSLLLTARPTSFLDQVPFTLERLHR